MHKLDFLLLLAFFLAAFGCKHSTCDQFSKEDISSQPFGQCGSRDKASAILNENRAAAYLEMRKAANRGDVEAMIALGGSFADGVMFAQVPDLEKASMWYSRAVKKGSKRAVLYLAELKLAHDLDKSGAITLLQEHEKAYLKARLMLGRVLFFGEYDVKTNKEMGKKLIQSAADDGDGEAWYTLGVMDLLNSANYEKAIMHFEKAAELGFPLAYAILIKIYETKSTRMYNKEKAEIWKERLRDAELTTGQLAGDAEVFYDQYANFFNAVNTNESY